jgi:hypothetical protein
MCYIYRMTHHEFATTIEELGMTKARTACVLGCSQRLIYYYIDGRREVPPLVGQVLRLLRSGRLTPADLGAVEFEL